MPYQQDTTATTTNNTPSDTVLAMLRGAIQSLDPNTLIDLLSEEQLDALGGSAKTPDEQLNELGLGCVIDWVKNQVDARELLSDYYSDEEHEVRGWIEDSDHYVIFSSDDTQAMQEWLESEHDIKSSGSECDWREWLIDAGWDLVVECESDLDLSDLDEDDLKDHLTDQGWLVYANTDDIELDIFETGEVVQHLRDVCGWTMVYSDSEAAVDALSSKGWLIYNSHEALAEDLEPETIRNLAEGLFTPHCLVRMLAEQMDDCNC